ncbi:hypothetical protein NLU13_4244 [Sarocladium strictum]|uniref:lytic cellulose monooxygenase (C4-dehydrogenating) n=1 Tax=Sarocladium strictum TaxID=5046 RepID=A0AA39GII0_SARSR|nr:hypothetical protein NLU13_4244 [Sarocladium strictum]
MKVLTLLASASAVSAHTIFQSLVAGGRDYGQGNGVRIPTYNGPIEDVSSNSMACNGNPNPTSSTPTIIDVQAGSEVTALWRYMLSTTGTSPNDIMDSTHKGPTLAYLKKVSNAASDSGVGGGWFKIQEDGFSNGVWGTEKVINGKGEHKIKIPDCIEPGQYLLRVEMIALHGAASYPGAQFYMECAQINVIGGSGTANPSTVSFPGAYSSSDPGVKISIYYPPVTNYVIPGPRPLTCSSSGGNNGGGSNPPPAATTTLRTSTTTTATTSRPPASTTSASSGGAAQWAQCGGINYSGPKGCVAPYTCTVINDYYHQCT